MNCDHPWLLVALAAVIALAAWIGYLAFSPDALVKRRRRRNNRRVESKVNRPVVRLSVRTPSKRK